MTALLQDRLLRAIGSMLQSQTTMVDTLQAESMRSCAAAAIGSKGRDSSPSTALQISGASFIGRLLQSILRRCYLTVFLPLGRVLQSIARMMLYYAKTAMKLIVMSSALLRDVLILCTPLQLAACFHFVEAYMNRNLYTYHCESDHCRGSAVSAPSAQKIATIALTDFQSMFSKFSVNVQSFSQFSVNVQSILSQCSVIQSMFSQLSVNFQSF